jgi:methionyl-tRNA formyltransferase
MKIVYMGTPEFAVPPLESLHDAGYDVALVLTQPDKSRDRGKKVKPTPIKIKAQELGIPVIQPEVVKDNPDLIQRLNDIKPDLIVVVAYGRILPAEILDIPRLGCINIHASLLPKFRGAAPIQRAILSGDESTGVTLMYLSEGMDEGDIIASVSTPIYNKTAGDLFQELSLLGARLLIETLPEIEAGTAPRIKQDPSLASYTKTITKAEGKIDFCRTSVEIERQIRAMNPWPGAYTYYKEKQVKLIDSMVLSDNKASNENIPGKIVAVDKTGITVMTGNGLILIKRLQMPGKREMDVADFIKGNKIEIGTILG